MKKLVCVLFQEQMRTISTEATVILKSAIQKVARMIAGIKGADMFRIEQKIP